MSGIRVLLADDHPVVRSGIRNLLDQEPDIQVVGEAQDGLEVVSLVQELSPDVLLLDMEMPGMPGVQVARQLQAARSPVRILGLSAYDDRQYILNLLANGAAGYLSKEEAPQRIVEAVRGVWKGEEEWLSPQIAAQVQAWAQDNGGQKRLTAGEMQVVRLVVEKKSNPEIARALGVEPEAVEARLTSVFAKLGVSSRLEAAVEAVRQGLVVTQDIEPIRVLIVDDIPLMANIVADMLNDEPDIEVAACATTVGQALRGLDGCDVALVNTTLPGDGALALVRNITRHNPEVKALVMGLREVEPTIVQYVEAGAAGYVLRESSADELLGHVRAVQRQAALVSPEIVAALMDRLRQLATSAQAGLPGTCDDPDLTPREREVLLAVGEGLSNREIAERLVIEVGTVKNHLHNIFQKLEVHSRQDAAAYIPLIEDCL